MGKSRLKSKTYYFAGLLLAVGTAILAVPELQAFLSTLPPAVYGYVSLTLGIIAAILRELTKEPLS